MVSKKRGKIVRRSVKSRRRTVSRPAGAFGMYRSTKFSTLRAVARVIKPGRTLTPFPDAKLVKHIYADTITLPAGAGAGLSTKYQFRCNSAYDPDLTSTGHQPLYYYGWREEEIDPYAAPFDQKLYLEYQYQYP